MAQHPQYQLRREMSIEDLLLENRIVYLGYPIGSDMAKFVVQRLLYLQSTKRDQEVSIYINSPGGYVDQTLAIYDTMQFLTCDVATYCIGTAASGAAILLAAGTKGKRYVLPHSKVMLHQPYGGITGQAEDIRIQAEEVLRDKKTLIDILAKHTGQDKEKIEQETERDRYLSADEAREYGLVDEILGTNGETKKDTSKNSGK
jgi:ATP-dependent Clp protease protease subunit